MNTVIWGGLVIRGRRYELHLTRFCKCIAGADFITECPCVFFLQFISTMENIIIYFIWHFSSSDTFYVFSVMYRAMDERQRYRWRGHRWRMEDNVQRSQMKMGWKTQAKIMISRYLTLTIKVKIKKNHSFHNECIKKEY